VKANIPVPLGTHMRERQTLSNKTIRTGALLAMVLFAGSAVPVIAQTTDRPVTRDMDDDGGFDDWGLLGLLGLAGLMGRGKKDRVVNDTRRV